MQTISHISPTPGAAAVLIHSDHWTNLDPTVAYRIAQVRETVFVVEQQIVATPVLDGRDLEKNAEIWWATTLSTAGVDDQIVATLRVLKEDDNTVSIGRVATLAEHRKQGISSTLIGDAIKAYRRQTIELHAQAQLEEWYTSLGFVRVGDTYEEAGLPHVMMRREPDVCEPRRSSS